ncbi:TetR/AcrR family transcriptional regulator [Cyanobium sp. NIES-981]|uniref:TetR/AcrR family transcriptional regulator n=1 Tax=Cyanobium sp. NIES-981 TaxID=1851505 RepID=UPI0007DE20B9|nr:TetR/AcrR family transcriptional regulator [Cyanobium sp. NIES-981]SBO43368.1 Transcriptional regulator [Cyanobium sp. NIES-981]
MPRSSSTAAPAAAGSPAASPRREHLLDVAQRLFSCQGFHAVGIDAVLAEAGVAKMTLYKHFRSKNAMIAAVLERLAGASLRSLQARVEAEQEPRARVLAVFDWLEQWVSSSAFRGCLFLKAAGEFPDSEDLPRQRAEAFKAGCGALLEQLCRALPLPGPEAAALARQLQLLLEGAIVLADLQRQPGPAISARAAAATLLDAAL